MTIDLEIPFDRVTYRDGQLLDARDLRDDHRRESRLRRLHVRYLHGTSGIAFGFDVAQLDDKRVNVDTGGTALVVGPGYAVDESGRDLLLPESVQPPLPTSDGRFVLAAVYREDKDFQASAATATGCLTDAFDPREDRVGLAWRRSEDVRFGPEVPVVQITIANGTIASGLDLRVRRYAQPFTRPHTDMRVTDEGRSGWRDWVAGSTGSPQELGLELDVNTSDAGFLDIPFYFAVLLGDFSNGQDQPLFEPDLWPQGEVTLTADSLGFITAATPSGFTYRVLNVGQNPFLRKVSAAEAERRHWRVAWFGLEPVKGCEPTRNLSRVFMLSGFLVPALSAFTRRRV